MVRRLLLCWGLFLVVAATRSSSPEIPHPPKDFNIHCDVCETMGRRTVPYCERDDQNMDFLPDFCTFNYNRVLRSECDYLVQVMEFVWCPSACEEIRRLQSFTGPKICRHPLVNCTERVLVPSPSVSPSPSPSSPIPADCILCEFVLKHVAIMCMNNEHASPRNIYHVCMEETKTKQDFEHCQRRLHELVAIAATEDPCTMLSCSEPRVACKQLSPDSECRVVQYNSNATDSATLGLDQNGNFLFPSKDQSAFAKLQGLGPSDFRPGPKPYHSLEPRQPSSLPPNVRMPGHGITPLVTQEDVEEIGQEAEKKNAEVNQQATLAAEPTPVPLKDIKMQ